TFQSLLSRFPDSRKAPDGLLKVGYCQYELGDTQRAASTLNEVVSRFPDTPVARLAQGRLRALRLDGR
ncbi:MAG: tetratricopeptide repeat protein, partial [Rhodanobacteraceae bacterium]|nr:tetratricopeptide repeat protein [Rhodanobacteraceae bacterium]